jgi:hypothetical protein
MFRKTIINISDINYNIIKGNVKLKHLPNVNDIIYFDTSGVTYNVIKILHHIDKRNTFIWVIVEDNKKV